jgi:PKD repeat protein
VKNVYDGTGALYDWASDIEVAANGDLYAAFGVFSEGRVFKSTDGGTVWSDLSTNVGVSTAQRIELACAPSNSSVVYAVASLSGASTDNDVAWVKRSTDGGTTWASLSIPVLADDNSTHFTRGQSWYDLILKVHPTNPDLVIAGGIDLHRTVNGTAGTAVSPTTTWTGISHWYGGFSKPYVHADQHAIEFRPGSLSEVAFGNDGGVHYSTNAGNSAATPTFSQKNNGYNVTQFYSVSGSNVSASNQFLAGSQDNGTQIFYTPQLNLTTTASGGDGGFCHIDQLDPDIQISSYTYNSFNRSLDGGRSFTKFVDQAGGHFINPSAYDSQRKILYSAGNSNVLKRFSGIDATVTATDIGISVGSSKITALKVSPYNDVLFAGIQNGRVYKISNPSGAGPTLTRIDQGTLPITSTGWISSIDVGANDNQILVTFSNYGVTSVWETTDGGTNWYSKEGDLPDMPIRWAIYNPNNRNRVMAATELGVWTTDNFGTGTNGSPAWGPSNTNLAHTRCDMLYFRPADGMVSVATHGRGMYTTDAFVTSSSADFTVSSTSSCTGSLTVNFTDNSAAPNNSWAWDVDDNGTTDYTTQNPTHTYSSPGVYSVRLTVNGGASSMVRESLIVVGSSEPSLSASCNISSDLNTGNVYDIGIYRFAIGNLDKTTSHNDGPYNNYACTDAVVLNLGTAYDVTIRNGKSYNEAANVYIDYNDDGSFNETNEKVATFALGKDERTVAFTTPTTGVNLRKGLRMRVTSKYSSAPTSSCDQGEYSQIEDYTVYFDPEFTWTGAVSTAWALAGNWSPEAVPGANDHVVVPDAASNRDPVLGANTTVGNLTVASGAKIGLNGNTLTVSGVISGTGTLVGSASSSLAVSGVSGTVYFDPTTPGTTNLLQNLTLSGSGTTVLGNALNITGGSAPGTLTVGGTAQLQTGGYLVLKSNSTGTAMVGAITSTATNPVSGNVTVERYIPAGRKWRLLTAPLKGSTDNSVFYNWQRNGSSNGSEGVTIWGPPGGTGIATGPAGSLLYYDNSWQQVTNTTTAQLFNSTTNNSYALFVTGPYGSSNISSGSAATTLSATGSLITGTHIKSISSNPGLNQYFLVGNPYASPLDPTKILLTNTENLTNTFWMWDASAGAGFGYGVGTYVAFNRSPTPAYSIPDGTNGYSSSPMTHIQSGQAFFVQAANAGANTTITFEEADKSTTQGGGMFGPTSSSTPDETSLMRIALQQASDSGRMRNLDGAVAFFYEDANPKVDWMDGTKFMNGTENLFFTRTGTSLTFEHRPMPKGRDTLFIRITNMRPTAYRLSVEGRRLGRPGDMAVLVDRYTGRNTPLDLDGTVTLDFGCNSDSASTGDRFMVLLTPKPASSGATTEPGGPGVMKPYPNPVSGNSPVRVDIDRGGAPWDLRLLDATGRTVWTRRQVGGDAGRIEIDMSGLPSGVYRLVSTDANARTIVSKIVKQ